MNRLYSPAKAIYVFTTDFLRLISNYKGSFSVSVYKWTVYIDFVLVYGSFVPCGIFSSKMYYRIIIFVRKGTIE